MTIYRYGLKYNPPRIGFIPSKALIEISKDKDLLTSIGTSRGECYHGILTYGRMLTGSECLKHGMDFLWEEEL